MFDMRLACADALKLRRRRGMLALAILLTIGVAVLAFTVMAIQHSSAPAKHGPAGGPINYQDAVRFLGVMVLVMGAIVGATAGAQDLESGVFRDLAATGRSRLALFAARVPGAWAIALPITAVTAALVGGASVALAGSLGAPSAAALVAGTAGLLAAEALGTTLAVALSA